ncbi:MAG: curli-like amyloid fiber formation chaperone CsgH [Pseudomonadota bacterium]
MTSRNAAILGTIGAGLFGAVSATGETMDQDEAAQARSITLDVQVEGNQLVARILGHAKTTRQVSFSLEVTGSSTSKHNASTTLAAGAEATLSTIKVTHGENWCARAIVEEAGQEPYELSEGPCSAR